MDGLSILRGATDFAKLQLLEHTQEFSLTLLHICISFLRGNWIPKCGLEEKTLG
jgi:hypothetical protein